MYNLCSGSIEEGKRELPKQKNLEEILKQELAWTLEQVILKILALSRVKPIYVISIFGIEEKVSCKSLIKSEIDSSVTPISALFSWFTRQKPLSSSYISKSIQIGEENEVEGTSSQEMASFSNEAFQRDEEIET